MSWLVIVAIYAAGAGWLMHAALDFCRRSVEGIQRFDYVLCAVVAALWPVLFPLTWAVWILRGMR